MILADTSVWVDHLRGDDAGLAALLRADRIVMHPFVIGEIALGTLRNRTELLALLASLPLLPAAEPAEVALVIDRHRLFGRGIGYVDAALLAACLLVPGTRLLSRDRRLGAAAADLALAA